MITNGCAKELRRLLGQDSGGFSKDGGNERKNSTQISRRRRTALTPLITSDVIPRFRGAAKRRGLGAHKNAPPETSDLDSLAEIALSDHCDLRPIQSIRLTTTLVFFAMAISVPLGEMANLLTGPSTWATALPVRASVTVKAAGPMSATRGTPRVVQATVGERSPRV